MEPGTEPLSRPGLRMGPGLEAGSILSGTHRFRAENVLGGESCRNVARMWAWWSHCVTPVPKRIACVVSCVSEDT